MQIIALINQKGGVGKNCFQTINKYYKLFLLTSDKLFQYLHSYKKFENRSVGGAKTFPALWYLLKGFFILNGRISPTFCRNIKCSIFKHIHFFAIIFFQTLVKPVCYN